MEPKKYYIWKFKRTWATIQKTPFSVGINVAFWGHEFMAFWLKMQEAVDIADEVGVEHVNKKFLNEEKSDANN